MLSQTYYKVLKINALTQAKTIIAQHVRYMVWFEQNNNSARAPLTPLWYFSRRPLHDYDVKFSGWKLWRT